MKKQKEAVKLATLFADRDFNREPIRLSLSIDKSVVDELKAKAGSVALSRAVERILRVALERGAV